ACAMDHRAVADVALLLHHAVEVGRRMHDAVVLQVRVRLHHDATEIAAQHGTRPDVAAGADDDVADQHGARVHPGRRVDHRDDALEGVNGRLHGGGRGRVVSPLTPAGAPPTGTSARRNRNGSTDVPAARLVAMPLQSDLRTIFLVAACTAALGSATFVALRPMHPHAAGVLSRHAWAMGTMSVALLLFAIRDAFLTSFAHLAPNLLACI